MKEKKPLYKRWWFWAIAVFILFIIIIGSSGGDTSTDSGSSGDEATSAPTEEQVSYGLNDEVTAGDVKWIVTDAYTAEVLDGAFTGKETTQGKFVVVNVTVENLGKDMKSMTSLDLRDNQGREYTSSVTSFKNLGAEQLYILENLNPNLPYTFADVYEVPKDAEGFTLRVGDLSLFGNKEAFVELGF